MKTLLNITAFLFILLAVSKSGWAGAMASAEVEIDWSSITFNLPSYTFVEQSTLSEADASFWPTPESSGSHSTPPSDSEPSWGPTNVAAGAVSGFGSSIADSNVLESLGNASAFADGTGSEGSAHTVRNALFLFAESGSAQISFNYLLTVSLSASEKGDYAMGLASFDAAFAQIEGGDEGGVLSRTVIKSVFGPGSFSDTNRGTITFTEQISAGDKWGFAIDTIAFARATNDIDEPSVLLLFFLGVLVIVGGRYYHTKE